MLHPVGDLPAAVYWRRRLVLLALLLLLLGGVAWVGHLVRSGGDDAAGAAASTEPSRSVREPALERVVPPVGSISTPTPPAVREGGTEAAATVPGPPGPAAGGPCGDDMLSVEVRTPPAPAVGSKPTFELVVANVSAVPCVTALDKGLQELLLLDQAGARVWGSNDCFPETGVDTRTLAPGEVVSFPVLWGGLTSEPTCTAERVPPAAGAYVLRGRLGTKVSADVPLTLG